MKYLLLALVFTLSLQAYNFNKPEFKEKNLFYRASTKSVGQSTWFVYGIVRERLGINLKFSQNYGRYAKNWPKLLNMRLHKTPKANSIAVFNYNRNGHLIFVVDIEGREIFVREANIDDNNYLGYKDGDLQVVNLDRFEQGLRGYLYLNP